jgi:uncharacterized protein GlcG (DUF336 family)
MSIRLGQARTIIDAAISHARARELKPLTVVVLDAGGHVVAADREDGASNARFEIALAKASGSLALGMGSRALMARAEAQPYFIAAATAAVGGRMMPVPGGVLILSSDGSTIGAVGVSGDASDHDESCAVEGIHVGGLVAQVD